MDYLERESALPRYHLIANIIRGRIDLQEWGPGEQLPSESAIAAAFKVSPMTVRQALTLLVQEGCLFRRRGLGTFVTEQREEISRVRLTVPFNEVTTSLANLEVRLLDIERVGGPKQILKALAVVTGDPAVRIRRVRLNGERIMSYAIAYLPTWLGDQLTAEDLTSPLLINVLEAKTGVFFQGANQTVEGSLADEETATVLQVPIGSPVLLVQRTYELSTGEIAYVAVNRYPSHLFHYEVRLIREGFDRPDWHVLSGAAAKGDL